MLYRFLADALVVFHFAFVLFVVAGGFFVLRWPRVAFAHIPAAAWGVFVEWSGRICPLTPIENHLRELGGGEAYQGGFVDHYVMPVLYPAGITRRFQFQFGAAVLVITIAMYTLAIVRVRRRRRLVPAPAAPGTRIDPVVAPVRQQEAT